MNEGKFNSERSEGEEHSETVRQLTEIFAKCSPAIALEYPGHQNVLHYDMPTIAAHFGIGPEQGALQAAGLRLESDVFGRTLVPIIEDSDKFVAVLESQTSQTPEEFHRGIEQLLVAQITRSPKEVIMLHTEEVRGWLGRLPESCEVDASSLRLERAQALDEFIRRRDDIFLAAHQRGVAPKILDRLAEFNTATREDVLLEYSVAREMGALGDDDFAVKSIEFLTSGLSREELMLDKVIDRVRNVAPGSKTYEAIKQGIIDTIDGRIAAYLQAQQSTDQELDADQQTQRQALFALIKLKQKYIEKFS